MILTISLDFETTALDRRLLAAIAEFYHTFDMLPSETNLKAEVDRANSRIRKGDIRRLLAKLVDFEYIRGPGEHTGRYYTEQKGRELLGKILHSGWQHERLSEE